MGNIYIETLLFSIAISFDSLVSFFGYGIEKIKVGFLQIIFIMFINTVFLAVGLFCGHYLSLLINYSIIKYISFSLLLMVGLFKLPSDLLKLWLSKHKGINNKTFLKICIDPINADINKDKILSFKESLFIGIALSIDSLGVGLGLGVNKTNQYLILIFSFIIGLVFSYIGYLIGKKVSSKTTLNLSWLSGVLLILLAILKIV